MGRRESSLAVRRFLVGIGLIGLVSLGWFIHAGGTDEAAAFFLTQGRLWELAAGCLLHVLLHGAGNGPSQRLLKIIFRCPAWAALLVLMAVQFLPKSSITVATILTIAASCALIASLMRESWVKELLLHPWVRHIGLISYSLYLWHWSVLTLSRWTLGIHGWTLPLQLLLMLGLAELSWRFLETPLRRHRWTPKAWQTLPVGLGVNGLVAIALALAGVDERGRLLFTGVPAPYSGARDRSQMIPGTTVKRDTCLIGQSRQLDERSFDRRIRACSTGSLDAPAGPARRIFLLGDSHASALLPLARSLHEHGFEITHLAREGCPFPPAGADHALPGCREFQQRAAQTALSRSRPGDAVIIAGYHLSHLGDASTPENRDDFLDAQGRPIEDPDLKLKLYGGALERFREAAANRGITVILVGAGPRLLERDICLPEWFRPEAALGRCRRSLERDRERARRLNKRLRQQLPRLAILDADDLICRQGCSLAELRDLLWDVDHLTEKAAARLEEPLLTLLAPGGSMGPGL